MADTAAPAAPPPVLGARVRFTGESSVAPPECACCREPASRADKVVAAGREFFFGYCETCSRHQGALRTQRLAVFVASGVLGATLASALPLVPRGGSPWILVFVALGVLAPAVAFALRRKRPPHGHAALGPAVRARGAELECANPEIARFVADLNGASVTPAPYRESRWHSGVLLHLLWTPLLAWFVFDHTRPVVRVVNLTGDPISVDVDGVRVLSVAPTSVESPSAGAEIRVAAGSRTFVARRENGEPFTKDEVEVKLGHLHLFAPGSDTYCFWLEESAVGQRGAGITGRTPLSGPPHFWVLPEDLGGFFAPAPASVLGEGTLSGGVITVLRQAPCELAPGATIGK
jgi:hypothetical protein